MAIKNYWYQSGWCPLSCFFPPVLENQCISIISGHHFAIESNFVQIVGRADIKVRLPSSAEAYIWFSSIRSWPEPCWKPCWKRQTERVEDVFPGCGSCHFHGDRGPTWKVLWQSLSTQARQSSLRAANTRARCCVSTQNADMFSFKKHTRSTEKLLQWELFLFSVFGIQCWHE